MIGTRILAQQTHPTARPAPLASHPHFTLALTLWCAALLGLPVVAISGAWLESWVIAARIDTILPAAAPPLGATARLLLATGFGVVGAGIGWLAARLLRPAPLREGDAFQLRQRDRHPDAPARRPISAHAELGDEGLGSASAERDIFPEDLAAYRALPEETAYQPPYHRAPFAQQAFSQPVQPAMRVFAQAPAPAPAPPPESAAAADAYDLPNIDFTLPGETSHAPYPSPLAETGTASIPEPVEDDWDALPPVVSETDLRPVPVRAVSPVASITPIASAPSLRAVDALAKAPPAKPAPVDPPALIGATPVQPRASASERIAHAALGDLSHVELIERLALAIHSRDKSATPVAVNDAQDDDRGAAPQDDGEEMTGTQASLRSALASLREVK